MDARDFQFEDDFPIDDEDPHFDDSAVEVPIADPAPPDADLDEFDFDDERREFTDDELEKVFEWIKNTWTPRWVSRCLQEDVDQEVALRILQQGPQRFFGATGGTTASKVQNLKVKVAASMVEEEYRKVGRYLGKNASRSEDPKNGTWKSPSTPRVKEGDPRRLVARQQYDPSNLPDLLDAIDWISHLDPGEAVCILNYALRPCGDEETAQLLGIQGSSVCRKRNRARNQKGL